MKLGEYVLVTCMVAALVHCDTLAVTDGDPSGGPSPADDGKTDGGGDGSSTVTGEAAGKIELVAVEGQTLVRAKPTPLKVSIKRTAPFAGKVAIALASAPSGVTSEPLEVLSASDVGDLVVTAAKTVPLGKVSIVVEATAPGTSLKATTFPLDLTVKAASGDLDVTFGTDGVLATNGTPLLAVQADGRFFITRSVGANDSSLHFFTANGQVDSSFSDDGTLTLGNRAAQLVPTTGGLFVATTQPGPGAFDPDYMMVRRFLSSGSLDTAWGDPTDHYVLFAVAVGSSAGLAVASNGKVATVSGQAYENAGWTVAWLTATGALDTSVNAQGYTNGASTPTTLVRGVHDGMTLSAVGDNQLIRLSATNGALVSSFGTSGKLTFPAASALTSVINDGEGRIVVGGMGTDALYLGRATSAGVDTTFALGGYATHPAKSGGAIVQQADKKIVQVGTVNVGGVDRCVVLRYLADGKLDPSFGNAGVATPAVDGCVAGEVALQPDGKILIAGPKVIRLWP